MNLPYLSLSLAVPLLGSLLIALWPGKKAGQAKWLALVFSGVVVILTLAMGLRFDTGTALMQFIERYPWIPSVGVSYALGVDGISFPLVALSAGLVLLAVLASWKIEDRPKAFFSMMLLLEAGLIGVFSASDYILFYIFWEMVLVPMYFLIGIWGGPRREYAALKFFIYTLAGSVIMLVGILALYFAAGARTFDILALANHSFSPAVQWWVFLAFFLGFAVKVPVFPFHTWLPDAHVEAPTGVSMLLAGVLLKMGAYGFLRMSLPTLPMAAHAFAGILAVLGVINIVYGALTAMAQTDMKKLVAYSSVSHMGYVLLGVAAMTPAALNGAVFQMVSHGLISALLFFMVGTIYERTHTRQIAELGGLFRRLPNLAVLMAFASIAALGLPGLSGFIAEFFVLVGAYKVYPIIVGISILGLVFTAAYFLWMVQRVLMGKTEGAPLGDASWREVVTALPLVLFIVVLGVYPGLLTRMTDPVLGELVTRLLAGGN